MDKEERLKRSKVFTRIKQVRDDAVKAKKWAETDGTSEYHFWDGYLEGVDYVMFLLEDIKFQKNKPKPKKKPKKTTKKTKQLG